MADLTRAKLIDRIASACTPEEKQLAEALLYGYNAGELQVLTDTTTGEMLFAVSLSN